MSGRTKCWIGALSAAAMMSVVSNAYAIDRPCPSGKVWSAARGACITKTVVRKRSPAQKFYLGSQHIDKDKKIKRPRPKLGVRLITQSCRGRYAPACSLLGFLYLNGRVVKANPKKSLKFYTKACNLKKKPDPHGCLGAAEVHSRGVLGKIDHTLAFPFTERACTLNSGEGCYALATRYRQALGVKSSWAKSRAIYKKSFALLETECNTNKIGTACHKLGESHRNGRGTRYNSSQAFVAYNAGCEAGSGDSCYEVGSALAAGRGTKIDKLKALRMYDKSCREYDNPTACFDAGVIVVVDRIGTDTDKKSLFFWGKRACELDKKWCNLLAHLYDTGKGGVQDKAKAVQHYMLACNNGNKQSCKTAGYRFLRGTGVAQDKVKGAALMQKGCDMGHGESCGELAYEYYYGYRLKKDRTRAFELYRLGCLRRHGRSCDQAARALVSGLDGTGVKSPSKAVFFYQRACWYKMPYSCLRLANLYLKGEGGVKKSGYSALTYFRRACRQKISTGCTGYGDIYYHGKEGVRKNLTTAGIAYAEACSHGHWKACFWVDDAMREGKARYYSKSRARRLVNNACTGSSGSRLNSRACLAMARAYIKGGGLVPKNAQLAMTMYTKACVTNSDACIEMGHMYNDGIGVVRDRAKAKQIYTTECNKGRTPGCTWLGVTLRREKQYAQASRLLRASCDKKDAVACLQIGYSHYTGQGVRWDVNQARKDYEKSCAKGNEIACSNMAELYWHGISVKPDLATAAKLFEKGCTQNSTAGCTYLGRFHEKGLGGIAPDEKRAEELYKRSCGDTGGTAEGCRFLAELYQRTNKEGPSKVAQLFQRALDLAKESAKENPYSKYVLGQMYRDGIAAMKNPKRALELFTAGCEGKDPLACTAAGEMNLGKRGTEPNYDAARVAYNRACAAGLAKACTQAAEAKRLAVAGPAKPVKVPDTKPPKVPLEPKGKRGGGCCEASMPEGGPAGTIALVLAVALGLSRRRRSGCS